MKILKKEVKHPWIALLVIFGISVVLSDYGVTKGTLLIFNVILGIALYRLFTAE